MPIRLGAVERRDRCRGRAWVVSLCLVAWVTACRGGRDPSDLPPATHAAPAVDPGVKPAEAGSDLLDEQQRFDADRRPELIVAAAGLRPGAVVADIGAGTGLLTVHLARAVSPGGRVVATDIDGALLELLRQRMSAAGLSDVVEAKLVAADDPGLPPNTFDVILLAEVDHYFVDRVSWLRAALGGLRKGGRVVLTNRLRHQPAATSALVSAGLEIQSESAQAVSHFIVVARPSNGR